MVPVPFCTLVVLPSPSRGVLVQRLCTTEVRALPVGYAAVVRSCGLRGWFQVVWNIICVVVMRSGAGQIRVIVGPHRSRQIARIKILRLGYVSVAVYSLRCLLLGLVSLGRIGGSERVGNVAI